DRGVPRWLFGHAAAERTEEDRHGFVGLARAFHGGLQFSDLHLSKGEKDVIFAREIVEKGAFANVGSFGDVLYGGFGKAFLGEDVQSSTKEPFANFGAAALTPVGERRRTGRGGVMGRARGRGYSACHAGRTT